MPPPVPVPNDNRTQQQLDVQWENKKLLEVCVVPLWGAVAQLLTACCQALNMCLCLPVVPLLHSFFPGNVPDASQAAPALSWGGVKPNVAEDKQETMFYLSIAAKLLAETRERGVVSSWTPPLWL